MITNIRERPICRRVIIDAGLRPHLDENGKWDRRCVDPQGQIDTLSDGMRKQMRLMISEGCWDEEAA